MHVGAAVIHNRYYPQAKITIRVIFEVAKLLPIIHVIKTALSKKGFALLPKGIIPSG